MTILDVYLTQTFPVNVVDQAGVEIVSGGKTYGHICQDKLDLGFLKLTRREMVYYNRFGGQSEPDVLQMYWEDDSRLIINGWAYDNPLDD